MSSIVLIWYKLPNEELKDLKYVFDTMNDDMVELQAERKECGELDVFLEQDYSAHSLNTIYFLPSSQREDKGGEESEDEQPVAEEEDGIKQEANQNDDGKEVLVDA
ncbi:hypothetical protein F2Q70_00001533 [Brassica cretica]|uniref:Uncharacterized protein n=1 Tax=Brassica cretica TaxID=69181 RepID=A0A3N6PRB5_BRACR|nr:hypothetical protein F2Q70_00001533 [Brassica cretica]KAF3567269.1 hypothetical protein DY000_02012529 [Brassica cretica]